MRKGARAYFAANMASQLCALLRYILLARLLGPFELGIAAALILTAAFFEAVSDTGADRFLIQDKDGDSPVLQSVVHVVMAGRGVLIAAALASSAALIAGLYRSPELQHSLTALAAAPLIGGLAHLDLRRVQRTADFRPESAAMFVSESLSLMATAVAAWVTRDHTAVVYGLVIRSIALVAVSHVTAKRPYRWAFAGTEIRTFGAFASPLALSGLMVFAGSQGDRIVVGSALGPSELGHYSAVLLLVYYPAAMLGRFLAAIHLPQLAGAKYDLPEFEDRLRTYAARVLLLGAVCIVGFAAVGPVVAPLVYGQQYAQPLQIFALLAVLQALRFVRQWPTNVAISLGHTLIVMFNNFAQLTSLPLALVAATAFRDLESIIAAFIVGEIIALAVALVLLSREGTFLLRRELLRVGAFLGLSAAACSLTWRIQAGAPLWIGVLSALVGVCALVAMIWLDRRTIHRDAAFMKERLINRN